MKLIHLIALVLVVVGGIHAVLSAVGVNMLGGILGVGVHMTVLHLVIGLATIYYVFPILRSHLNAQ